MLVVPWLPGFIYAQTTMHFSEMRWIDAVVQWLMDRPVSKVRFRDEGAGFDSREG
jgi:hypothetical protein